MTDTLVREMPRPSGPGVSEKPGPQTKHSSLLVPILLQITAMIGIGALVYSSAADWFATLNHNSEISGYTQAVQNTAASTLSQELSVARDYNAHMPAGMLRDPYANSGMTQQQDDAAYALYEQILTLKDTAATGQAVIGQLSYPNVGISLPIYHGTSDEVLTKGVGHLYGSSLPVGGPSTHSVLTSHSGLVHANLFTDLPKAKIDDIFTVQVLGETHWYRVDSIETVLPEQTERLQIVADADYVTLITCTPIGINSHRLLVRGERIPAPTNDQGTAAIAGDGLTAGFPWWALIFIGASGAVAYLLFVPRKKPQQQATQIEPPFMAQGDKVRS